MFRNNTGLAIIWYLFAHTGVLKYFKSLLVHGQVGSTNSLVRTKEVLVRTFKIDKGKDHKANNTNIHFCQLLF